MEWKSKKFYILMELIVWNWEIYVEFFSGIEFP